MTRARQTTLLFTALLIVILLWHRRPAQHLTLPAAPMQHEPLLMLWAWETPEDLTQLDPARAGVAFLSRELLLSDHLDVRSRRQPLRVSPTTFVMADVRMEPSPTFKSTPALIDQSASAILSALDAPNIRALQIDFDATASQRDFYTAVLRLVHAHLPANIPLSITALTSWCTATTGSQSWLHNLPIDEAVPMFFRMGGPAATRATRSRTTASITEPLCATSVGIATDEAWPNIAPTQRVYVFQSGPWRKEDIAHISTMGYQSLR